MTEYKDNNPFYPFGDRSPEEQQRAREALEHIKEEWEVTGHRCPYCGEPDVACHRLRNHPEMWIGGSNAYGTPFHGWADH